MQTPDVVEGLHNFRESNFRQSYLLLANQNALLTTHEPIKNSRYKSQTHIEVASACERCVDESVFSFESSQNLHKNTESSTENRKTVKIRFFRGNTSK